MQRFNFISPSSIQELCSILADGGNNRIIAGGTDTLPRLQRGQYLADTFVDITKIDELRFIEADKQEVKIGSLATYDDLADSALLQNRAPFLCNAASDVGSYQTRQRGTIGGSLGNASPAGDVLPVFLALNTEVVLVNVAGVRRIPLAEFLIGPGKTKIEKHEFIHHLSFSGLPAQAISYFYKLGKRKAMACALVNIATAFQKDSSFRLQDVRIALGSVAPTPIRCYRTERLLTGNLLTGQLIDLATDMVLQECSPIDDIRATAEYRRHIVKQLFRRAFAADSLRTIDGWL